MKLSRVKEQRGEIGILLIIILLLILIGLIVWYALVGSKPQSTVTPPPPPKQSATPTPVYQGWKSYDLKYEGLSIKVPVDWTLKDYSATDEMAKNIAVNEGPYEHYIWTSPTGLRLVYMTHILGVGGACFAESDNAGSVDCPNVNVLAIEKLLTKNKVDLYYFKYEDTNYQSKQVESRGMGIMSYEGPQFIPKAGIKNEFPPYLFFTTKTPSPTTPHSTLAVSVPTTFGGAPGGQVDFTPYKAAQLKANLSTTDFFKQADWITADLILRSLQ